MRRVTSTSCTSAAVVGADDQGGWPASVRATLIEPAVFTRPRFGPVVLPMARASTSNPCFGVPGPRPSNDERQMPDSLIRGQRIPRDDRPRDGRSCHTCHEHELSAATERAVELAQALRGHPHLRVRHELTRARVPVGAELAHHPTAVDVTLVGLVRPVDPADRLERAEQPLLTR